MSILSNLLLYLVGMWLQKLILISYRNNGFAMNCEMVKIYTAICRIEQE